MKTGNIIWCSTFCTELRIPLFHEEGLLQWVRNGMPALSDDTPHLSYKPTGKHKQSSGFEYQLEREEIPV